MLACGRLQFHFCTIVSLSSFSSSSCFLIMTFRVTPLIARKNKMHDEKKKILCNYEIVGKEKYAELKHAF